MSSGLLRAVFAALMVVVRPLVQGAMINAW